MAEPLQVEYRESAEAFDQLQSLWQGLERLDNQCTPFNTWTWNSLWWQHYATARDRLILLIARQGNRVVGMAPLYIHATRMCKVIPVRVLRFIGTGTDSTTAYCNFIALPECRGAVERAFLDFLPRIDGWHRLQFTDMPRTSTLASGVGKLISTLPGVALAPQSHVIQKAALPATFVDYRRQLSRECRKQCDDRHNRLNAAGTIELALCATREELAEATDALVLLNRLYGNARLHSGDFKSGTCEQFHRAVIRQFFAMDALWLATLRLDGRIIGVQYFFAWRGELIFMHSGDSPEHDDLGLRHVLLSYAIERGIEQCMYALDMLKEDYPCLIANAKDQVHTVDLGYVRPGVRKLIGDAQDRLGRMRPANSTAQDSDLSA